MSDWRDLTISVPVRRRAGILKTLQGWVFSLWSDLISPRGYRVIAVILAAYTGLYAIMEARHERQTNLAAFEHNMLINMVTSGNKTAFISAMKRFGSVQTMFVLKEPPILEFWNWWDETQPNLEPLFVWATHRLKSCTSEECGGTNERKIDLSYADLKGSKLADVDLTTALLYKADLRSANLVNTYLRGADLTRANLQDANLERSKLPHATLRRADLQGTNMRRANLLHADLRKANLQNSNLEKANLRDADLESAELRSAILTKAKLRTANLERAKLRYVNLTEADLWNANLTGARLRGANLKLAVLWDANLTKTNLLRADLERADLRGVTGLTCKQLQKAQKRSSACRDAAFACGADIPPPKTCES